MNTIAFVVSLETSNWLKFPKPISLVNLVILAYSGLVNGLLWTQIRLGGLWSDLKNPLDLEAGNFRHPTVHTIW